MQYSRPISNKSALNNSSSVKIGGVKVPRCRGPPRYQLYSTSTRCQSQHAKELVRQKVYPYVIVIITDYLNLVSMLITAALRTWVSLSFLVLTCSGKETLGINAVNSFPRTVFAND